MHFNHFLIHERINYILYFFFLQSFVNSGDYDDEDDYPDLNERLEAYKSE